MLEHIHVLAGALALHQSVGVPVQKETRLFAVDRLTDQFSHHQYHISAIPPATTTLVLNRVDSYPFVEGVMSYPNRTSAGCPSLSASSWPYRLLARCRRSTIPFTTSNTAWDGHVLHPNFP